MYSRLPALQLQKRGTLHVYNYINVINFYNKYLHAQWNLLQTKNTFSISLFFTRSTAYVHIFNVYKYTLLEVTPLNSGVVLRNILAVRQGYASRAPLTSFFTRNWPCISFLYLKQRKLEITLKTIMGLHVYFITIVLTVILYLYWYMKIWSW